ncbi:nitric oxide synthase oxygenase [Evansella sp. AB-P1]|uniref:nitric oxide synthase oxygenase n=1 Tax=Evansella sp. AB-P1 TaxID=3037653 RepID=UPI00241F6AAF|nr:nitric oxide synthase oxygenase [Evansella sp. AB-P1]MDG5786022.1 nitric oxide synthase oxygenase [Evansella sp. AB-P1]
MLNALFDKGKKFIVQCYTEKNKAEMISSRLTEIEKEINETGSYTHSMMELEHGAKMAWRNSNKCIGRLFWDTLTVRDKRHLTEAQEIIESLEQHIVEATNKGKIKPMITVFAPQQKGTDQVRIWNHQLVRYAGYETELGIIGDPMSVRFTEVCEELGWEGENGHFDILPLVLQLKDSEPILRDIPKKIIMEVDLEHPENDQFKDLQLKWYALPAISDMSLEIGGIVYSAAPFNGWYMGTEIGARNLADQDRYNMLPKVASIFDLDISRHSFLWKDRALVELNRAVLYSYQKARVSIVDHHTAAEQFKRFERNEKELEREVTGNWSWLIPPISPAATHIFHHNYNDELIMPNFFYQKPPYE